MHTQELALASPAALANTKAEVAYMRELPSSLAIAAALMVHMPTLRAASMSAMAAVAHMPAPLSFWGSWDAAAA